LTPIRDITGREATTRLIDAISASWHHYDAMNEEIVPLTMSVPDAGWKYFGLSRKGSYAAAARGEIPTIKVGRLLRVPTILMEERLRQPTTSGQIK
jgi:hypothetical protein